jgi:hypothetical protein
MIFFCCIKYITFSLFTLSLIDVLLAISLLLFP